MPTTPLPHDPNILAELLAVAIEYGAPSGGRFRPAYLAAYERLVALAPVTDGEASTAPARAALHDLEASVRALPTPANLDRRRDAFAKLRRTLDVLERATSQAPALALDGPAIREALEAYLPLLLLEEERPRNALEKTGQLRYLAVQLGAREEASGARPARAPSFAADC